MNYKRYAEFTVIFLIILSFTWILSFFIIYIHANSTMNSFFYNKGLSVVNNLKLIEDKAFVMDNDILLIVDYDAHNFEDERVLFSKDGAGTDNISQYSNVFQYANPEDSQRRILIVFSEKPALFLYIIFFSAVFGVMVFIMLIFLFMNMKVRREKMINHLAMLVKYPNILTEKQMDELSGEFNECILEINDFRKNAENEIERHNRHLKMLQKENQSLKNKDVLKTGVIENISHELKSPLTKIKGYLDYIYMEKMGKLSETQKDGLLVAKKNVDALLEQIDQVLRYAKDETFKLEKEMFMLSDIIESVLETYQKPCNEKNITVKKDIVKLENAIIGDKGAMHEVFDNLLNNALKFTESGGIINVVGYEKIEDGIPVAIVKVEDTGIGIPTDKIDRIFDRFYQVENETKRSYPGMGLGLTIVRTIVEAHGGDIKVNSIIGKGTTFKVTIPLQSKGGADERK